MVKILSQSGITLADVYDVVGSVAGIEQLESREVSLVHEMGATLFSERFVTTWATMQATSIDQNTDIDVVRTTMPATPTRLLAVQVLTNDASRVLHLTMAVRDPESPQQEIPIWNWDVGSSERARFANVGAIGTFDLLLPNVGTVYLPTFVGGRGQVPNMVRDVVMRGRTTGFGAGTVSLTAILYFAFAFQRGLSSKGLPLPGW